MESAVDPPGPRPNWKAPVSTRDLADHHGARGVAPELRRVDQSRHLGSTASGLGQSDGELLLSAFFFASKSCGGIVFVIKQFHMCTGGWVLDFDHHQRAFIWQSTKVSDVR